MTEVEDYFGLDLTEACGRLADEIRQFCADKGAVLAPDFQEKLAGIYGQLRLVEEIG